MKSSLIITFLASCAALAPLAVRADLQHELSTADGITYGVSITDKVAFHGVAPVAQASGSAQSALTNSTTGTAGATLAAGAGVVTISIPIQLAAMTTSAAELISAYTPGYKFKILSATFTTTTIGAGSGASQVVGLKIGSTAVTGGAATLTLSGTNTLGKLTAATAITADNTGTSSDTITVTVAGSGTVFTGGAGILLLKVQNMDTADAVASLANLANALRSALVGKGLIKGGS